MWQFLLPDINNIVKRKVNVNVSTIHQLVAQKWIQTVSCDSFDRVISCSSLQALQKAFVCDVKFVQLL